jgi:hypothetical protein
MHMEFKALTSLRRKSGGSGWPHPAVNGDPCPFVL